MTCPRNGLGRLEAIVLLFTLVLLATLVLPALDSDRNRNRRFRCLNNMRNVGLAMQNYASQHGGKLPSLEDDEWPWPRTMLRLLDQPALDRKIVAGETLSEADLTLSVFTCPQNEDAFQQPGSLSYVVNGGYGFFPVDPEFNVVYERGRHSLAQDWNGNATIEETDRLVTRSTGVIWRRNEYVRQMTLDEIGTADGVGNTLLLAENLHAGSWTTRDIRGLAIVVDRNRLTFDRKAGELAVSKADLGPFAINGAKDATGLVPAPSSNHNGGVSVIWADGRGTMLSEDIDPLIYVRIMTPAGSLYGEQPIDDSMLP